MRSKLSGVGLLAGLSLVLGSCLNDDSVTPYQQLQEDIAKIDAYLATHPPDDPSDIIVKDAQSGIRMVITEMPEMDVLGDEPVPVPPTPYNLIKVNYTGKLFSTGVPFETSSRTFTLTTDDAQGEDVLKGWKVALSMMTQGMKATVYIPSGLAYGPNGNNPIPGNAILVFDLHLEIVNTEDEDEGLRFTMDKSAISARLEGEENVKVHPNGFSYILESTGSGPRPGLYDHVKISYTGKRFTDNFVFAKETGIGPITGFNSMPVNYIHGLTLGLQLMQEGDQATFYIPSALGYGPSASENIPANSILIFEVELLEVIPHEQ